MTKPGLIMDTIIWNISFLLILAQVGHGFLWYFNGCPNITSCNCIDSIICGGKSHPLSNVPMFGFQLGQSPVHLEDNKITSLPGDVFRNLVSPRLFLYLQNNLISSVATTAFAGLENKLYSLDLSINKLQTVPAALTTLTHLHDLYIQYNPITSFHGPLFGTLGQSLHALSFGSPELKSWPTEINVLNKLNSLSIYGIEMSSLPQNAFQGLGNVATLHIEETSLQGIPAAICGLHDLYSLNYSNNLLSDSVHLVPSCHPALSKTKNAYLRNNNLASFPSIYNIFPNLDRLYVQNNPRLTNISSSQIPRGTPTHVLSLDGNGFTSIPSVIHNIGHLVNLELQNNKITSISHVLDLPYLQVLYLDNNPIQTIATSVFSRTPNLHNLSLKNSGQTTLPEAISILRGLNFLELQGNLIRCTCALKWMTQWLANVYNPTFTNVYANCENELGMSVMIYARQKLGHCL